MTSSEQKKFRDRANRARRGLLKEKEECGYINDESGKRYRAAVYYVLAGANDKALDFYTWFEDEFPDDIGEPVFDLYWALAESRAGHEKEASYRLQVAMISNIYMLPYLFREPIETLDIWHHSNPSAPDYLYDIEEFLDEPTVEEREWIKGKYMSQAFTDLRNGYISAYHSLKYEHNFQKRSDILNKWYLFSAEHFETHG